MSSQGIIARTQKMVLFNQAAEQGISNNQILSTGQIYSQLLGITDIGVQQYGLPLAPIYTAIGGYPIDVSRMSSFFTGIGRDFTVLDIALTDTEKRLSSLNSELWARMQLVQARAQNVSQNALTSSLITNSGATWGYTETFVDTTHIDMSQTTAWIDVSEGCAYLPNSAPQTTVVPANISVDTYSYPTGASPVGTTPSNAFDGVGTTSWLCLFAVDNGQNASATISTSTLVNLSSITITPIGVGINLLIEVNTGLGFQTVVQGVCYSKSTYTVQQDGVTQVRVSFYPIPTNFPVVVGITNITLFTTNLSPSASVYSLRLNPGIPFTSVQVSLVDTIPNSSSIQPYVSTASGGPWIPVQPGQWNQIVSPISSNIPINIGTSIESPVFRGLYGCSVPVESTGANQGLLNIGIGQVEVTAFNYDWAAEGQTPHILVPGDFNRVGINKTWTGIPRANINDGYRVIQSFGTTLLGAFQLNRGQQAIFHRNPDLTDTPNGEMCIVPLGGNLSNNMLQFSYNYRYRFWVNCNSAISFGAVQNSSTLSVAKYWFLQGYRKQGSNTYRSIGKSWGSFSLYINDTLIAADESPYTVFDIVNPTEANGGLEVGSENGEAFSFSMNAGWNKVDIYLSLVNPSSNPQTYQNDPLDDGPPFLQLSITPDFFDSNFQSQNGITSLVSDGQVSPITEFDLIWNVPRDCSYWAWSDDLLSVLFNRNNTTSIDGFFQGNVPSCSLNYMGSTLIPSDLYVRVDLSRSSLSNVGPILNNYQLLVQ